MILMGILLTMYMMVHAQTYSTLGTWNSLGVPDYLCIPGDNITSGYVNSLTSNTGILPEFNDNSSYTDVNEFANLKLIDTTQVWITFISEGAGYKNSLGFYSYRTDSATPTNLNDLHNFTLIFPNTSALNSGGGLIKGDKVYLGEFPSNVTIGWTMIVNSYNINNSSVNYNSNKYYSNHTFNNSEVDSLKPHNVFIWDSNIKKYIIGFEDLSRKTGDNDFNDCMFLVTTVKKGGDTLTPPYGIPSLPVELLSFTAKRQNDLIVLNWTTASEINNDYFTIEKSYDMESWNNVSFIKGAGNSNELVNYEITDIENKEVYYRLSQTDFDGKTETFNIISVGNTAEYKVSVDMYDISGRRLKYIQKGLVLFLYSDGSVEKKYIAK